MLSPRWHKILAELVNYPGRTMLVVMSVAIGVFALGTIVCLQDIVSHDMARNWQAINYANVTIACEPFKADMVQAVVKIPGVVEVEGKKSLTLRVRQGDDKKSLQLLYYPDDVAEAKINKIKVVAGKWPPKQGQVFLEQATFKFMNAKLGDVIEVEAGDVKKKLTVAGTIHDGSRMSPVVGQTLYGYIGQDALSVFDKSRQFDTFAVKVLDGGKDPELLGQITRQIRNKIEQSGRMVWYTETTKSDEHPAVKNVNSLMMILGALGIGALLLSGFLIFNTISAVMLQQIRQIGIMKAVGASSRQIAGMYVVYVLGYGILALLVAIPLSGITANFLAEMIAGNFNFERSEFMMPLRVVAIQTLIGLGVPFLASLYPIWGGIRTTVRQAIASGLDADADLGKGYVDRMLEKVKGLPRPLLLSLRNSFRQKIRMVLTVAALTLSGAIFMTVLSVQSSLILTTDDVFQYFGYDIQASFNKYYNVDKLKQAVQSIPGVIEVECWGFGSVRILPPNGDEKKENESATVIAPPAETVMLKPTVLEGRWLLSEDENAIVVNSDVIKNSPWIKLGDELTLKIDRRKVKGTVVGIVRGVLMGPYVYINYPYFSKTTYTTGLAASVQVTVNERNALTDARIVKEMEKGFKASGMRVGQIKGTADVRNQIKSSMNFLIAFLLGMAVLMGSVGGLGLMGAMSMNVVERTREIGVMRAIGAPDRAILQIFIVEGMIVGISSWLLATGLAMVISRPISGAVGRMLLHADLSYSFSFTGVVYWLFIVIVISILASYVPARNASRIKVREALVYE